MCNKKAAMTTCGNRLVRCFLPPASARGSCVSGEEGYSSGDKHGQTATKQQATKQQCCCAARWGWWRSLQACNISLEADEAPCIRDDNCKAGLRCSAGQCVAAAAKKPGAEERRQRSLQAAF